MNTKIIDQKFFKDKNNQIYVIDVMLMNENTWHDEIKDGWAEITKGEAELIANPPPTEEEIDAKKEAENIAFLSYEAKRAADAIEILDDAIEFEMATDEEVAQHKELRKYRLLLSRVPSQADYPLNPAWPECPEFFV